MTKLLAEVPADSCVTVVGITDRSFSQPDILLSATIPADRGYFGERLGAARKKLTKAWQTKSQKLEPAYRQTDIVGAIVLAGKIFEENGSPRKLLVIYSDMWNSTPELNLESRTRIPRFEQVQRNLPKPDLRGVEALTLGVDGAGVSVEAWERMKGFWKQYLTNLSARLTDYKALRFRRIPRE